MAITMERVVVVGVVAGFVALVVSMVVEIYDEPEPQPWAAPEVEIEFTPEMRSCKTALDVILARCDVEVGACEATNFPSIVSLPKPRVLLLGDGHFVTVGSRFHEWFVADGQVFTANGGADMACHGLPNIDTRIRERAIEKVRTKPEWAVGCTMVDLEHARALYLALHGAEDERTERKVIRGVAKARGVSVKALKNAHVKVLAECPDAL